MTSEQFEGRSLRKHTSDNQVKVVNYELPKRTRTIYEPSGEDMRTASIFRIADEREIPLAEAEVVYDRLLEKIRKALDNS